MIFRDFENIKIKNYLVVSPIGKDTKFWQKMLENQNLRLPSCFFKRNQDVNCSKINQL